jgi:toxin YhaV
MERLVSVVEKERTSKPNAPLSGNAKLLGHLLDLAFVKIPRDPGNAAYRHGGTLADRRHWFRGKTGGGRYRLFYRYDSRARIIIYAWVNDEDSLRTYGSKSDAYAVFANMLDSGNPPDTWEALLEAASAQNSLKRLRRLKT